MRLITFQGTFRGTDSERGSNEIGSDLFFGAVEVEATADEQLLFEYIIGWGEELRFEMQCFGVFLDDETFVMRGETKLFEGASVTTDDLDAEKSFGNIQVKKDDSTAFILDTVSEEDSDDRIFINMTISNLDPANLPEAHRVPRTAPFRIKRQSWPC